MSIQYPKKERAGVNLVAYEVPLIYRDPPKAIFTRKKETVNVADVMYMSRPDNDYGDPTRINESIQVFARGRNPMVQVDMGQGQGVKSPYRIEVVRPPMMPLETLVAISRPHIHQNYAAHTNPGSSDHSLMSLGDSVDRTQIKGIIHEDVTAGIMRTNPNLPLEFGPTVDFNNVKSNITETLEGIYQTNAGLQYIGLGDEAVRTIRPDEKTIKDTLLKTLTTSFSSVTIYDPKTNNSIDISANIKDKNYIAINAAKGKEIELLTRDGTPVKLKDYVYSVVNTNAGTPQVVLQVKQPDIFLDRNTPLYASRTNMVSSVGYNEDIFRNAKLSFNPNDKLSNFGSYEDRVSRPNNTVGIIPTASSIRKNRNLSSISF